MKFEHTTVCLNPIGERLSNPLGGGRSIRLSYSDITEILRQKRENVNRLCKKEKRRRTRGAFKGLHFCRKDDHLRLLLKAVSRTAPIAAPTSPCATLPMRSGTATDGPYKHSSNRK